MIHLTSDQLKELRAIADIFKGRSEGLGEIPLTTLSFMEPFKGLKVALREDNSLEVSE
jgi:hypothetical protein